MSNKVVDLPRNLLDNILERLPIRDAVRTSIMSRKWRYIWSEIPQLVFDKEFFEQITRKGQLSVPAYKFVSVISKILLLHTGPILKFTLYIPKIQCDWEVHITQWLLFLSRNGLKEFSLDSSSFHPHKLSFPLPNCSNLTHLKLQTFIFKHPTMFGSSILGNLISLHLENITFHSDIGRRVFHAPILESLKFAGCTATDHFFILAPKLKTLFATDSGNVQLKCFKRTANLSILSIAPGKTAGNQGQDITTEWSTFLATVSNISKFSFDGFFLKLLDAGTLIAKLSVAFNNLEHLELNELSFDDLNQISCVLWLLNRSPNLRKLDMKVRLFIFSKKIK
ncbi:F-box/FBD/LRR-repeat protein At1g13570-like [Actinidia eriantha]|uniref:F-box/FBD/LRR-repeat protein At1g13570-like n=1 Tax=Actinidia eriantha TaxID=165200 RepID=UPI0025897E62|nr:F-box/FBD/LRR-repeat protein At1g13570-like [Actinidia eriantha]